jgi:hypothetical protein
LKLSLAFPPVHTVRATFTAYGVPTNPIYSFYVIACRPYSSKEKTGRVELPYHINV